MSSTPSPWPTTVIAPTYPATSMAPHALANPYSLTPYSTAPVAGDIADIDFDVESVSFRPRKRSKLGWFVAAAFIGRSATARSSATSSPVDTACTSRRRSPRDWRPSQRR